MQLVQHRNVTFKVFLCVTFFFGLKLFGCSSFILWFAFVSLVQRTLTSEMHGTLSCHQPWIGADFSTTIVWRFDAPVSWEAKSAYYRRCVLTSLSLHQGSPLTVKVLEPLNLVHVVRIQVDTGTARFRELILHERRVVAAERQNVAAGSPRWFRWISSDSFSQKRLGET